MYVFTSKGENYISKYIRKIYIHVVDTNCIYFQEYYICFCLPWLFVVLVYPRIGLYQVANFDELLNY